MSTPLFPIPIIAFVVSLPVFFKNVSIFYVTLLRYSHVVCDFFTFYGRQVNNYSKGKSSREA